MTARRLVERFYLEVWNHADEALARRILHSDFRFRASLGPERIGPDGFIDYMRAIHGALDHYRCAIDDLIATETRAAARVRFEGLHRGVLLGVPATGKVVAWTAAAFFTTDGTQITDLFVLGDIDAVKRRLGAPRDADYQS